MRCGALLNLSAQCDRGNDNRSAHKCRYYSADTGYTTGLLCKLTVRSAQPITDALAH